VAERKGNLSAKVGQ